MALVLLYLVVLVLVAIVLFGAASLLFGRGEQLPPLPRGTTATVLPASGVTGADVDAVKFTQTLRGYKTSEVDWVLDRLASELEACAAAGGRPRRVVDEAKAEPTADRRGTEGAARRRDQQGWTTSEATRCRFARRASAAGRISTCIATTTTGVGPAAADGGGIVRADEPGGLPERPVVADHPAQTGELPARLLGFDIEKVARYTDATCTG